MADQRVFTLIGNFTDNITPALVNINKALAKVKTNISELSQLTKPLKNDFRELAGLSKDFSSGLKAQAADLRAMTAAMKSARQEMGRMNRAYRAGGNRVMRTSARYAGGGGGGGGRSRRIYGEGRDTTQNIVGDVVSGNIITNAIVSGFQMGTRILQQGIQAGFGAFAERAKDQLEDIAAAGGIFSAGKFAKAEGLPTTFQEAMKMQDRINKEMAAIASNLPGTTHDYVENSRRLVDTTAQIMARDLQGFTNLAKELTGKTLMTGEESFRAVNVEISKATTLLEKMNPTKTVIPMTQIVEDMLKSEQVSIGSLRRYVAFKRGTTFEAALTRNLEEVNKAGAGTAARLKAIVKVLKEAVPAEMIVAFQSSVAGVVEGFKSAFLDPDVGLFGLSRSLSFQVQEFNKETGEKLGMEYSNFFKMFSEVFGNIGNLLNSAILPGLASIYQPFDGLAKSIDKLREYSFKIFYAQQRYTSYFEELASARGMKKEDFKVFEKGGVSALIDVLRGFNAIDPKMAEKAYKLMRSGGTAENVAANMKQVYADIIPAVLKSPFFKEIGKTLGEALALVLKEVAKIMKALLRQDYGSSEFVQAFNAGGGLKAINDILVYLAEGIGKAVLAMVKLFASTLMSSVTSGNFIAAGVLGTIGLIITKSILGFVQGCMGMLGKGGAACALGGGGAGGRGGRGGSPTGVGGMFGRTRSQQAFLLRKQRQFRDFRKGAAFAAEPFVNYAKTSGPGVAALKGASAISKAIPGGALVAGAIDTGIGLATGENFGKAAAGGIGTVIGSVIGTFINPGLGTMIGGIAGGLVGDAIADNVGGLVEKMKGPSLEQERAAALQLDAAKMQQQAAGLRRAGLEKPEYTFGTPEEFSNRLRAAGISKPLLEAAYGRREASAEEAKKLADQLNKAIAYRRDVLNLDEKTILEQVRPLQDAYNVAAKQLLSDQKEFARMYKEAGANFRNTVSRSFENINISAINAILQNKFGQLQMPTFNFTGLTVKPPPGTGFDVDPNPYNNPLDFKWENKNPNNASDVFRRNGEGWKRTSIGEGDCLSSMGGKTVGSVNAFNSMASSYGLTMTSGFRPGSPGWHGVDRARDYSNGYGPTPQMMRFAQFLATNYGSSLKELIYTPLGYSIKNGRKVAPYATAGHYNHVHVAYATGFPTIFSNQDDALAWEKKATMGNVSVASITAREGEFGGKGSYAFNNSITINQQSGESSEQLAARILTVMEGWVEDAVSSSYFV